MDALIRSNEPVVRVGPLANLPGLMRSLNCDPEPVCRASGFRLADFDGPDNRISCVQGGQLLQDCVVASGCPQHGLMLVQLARPSRLGIAGFLVRAAPDTETALRVLVENLELDDEGGSLSLTIGSEYTTISYAVHHGHVSAVDQIYDMSAALTYQLMRAICGPECNAENVSLKRHIPKELVEFDSFFRILTYFDTTDCAITFKSHWLRRVPSTSDRFLFQFLEKEARQQHEQSRREMMDILPVVLRRALLTEQFLTRQVANKLGMHERTLHRRLQAVGTTFRRGLDAARRLVSEELLETTDLPICEIATALGYSDSSGFIRAFHRWVGDSPAAWRRQFSSAGEAYRAEAAYSRGEPDVRH